MWSGQVTGPSSSGYEDENREMSTESSESELAEQGQHVMDEVCGVEGENTADDIGKTSGITVCGDDISEGIHSAANTEQDVRQRLLANEV